MLQTGHPPSAFGEGPLRARRCSETVGFDKRNPGWEKDAHREVNTAVLGEKSLEIQGSEFGLSDELS